MIQHAHLGVGIVGKEGLQAANAADFTLGQFKFLARLVLVHGHWAYHRTCFIAQYCFYKSIFICTFQLFFNTRAGFAGTSWFNSFSLTMYNGVFTALPPVFYVLDRNVKDTSLMGLLRDDAGCGMYNSVNPYSHGTNRDEWSISGELMNWRSLVYYVLRAIIQG